MELGAVGTLGVKAVAAVAWTGNSWVEVHSDLMRAEDGPVVGVSLGEEAQ